MGSLFAGPSSIKPWIEDTFFRALVHGPEPQQRPRLVQVLAQRLSNPDCPECPSFLVIHDGATSAIAFLSKNNARTASADTITPLPTKGCVVRISNWNVSLVQHAAGPHIDHLRNKHDAASSHYLELTPHRLCLTVQTVETLGAHGIGVVGNPIPVDQSVQVRRALESCERHNKCLSQQLKLVKTSTTTSTTLGNVQELFRPENAQRIRSLWALAKNHQHGTSTSTNNPATDSRVLLGNVKALLESSYNKPADENIIRGIMAMAHAATTATNKENNSTAAVTNGERKSTAARKSNGVVLGNVEALLAGRLDAAIEQPGGNPVDAIFAAAKTRDATASTQKNDSDTRVAKKHATPAGDTNEGASGAREESTSEAEKSKTVEPYGIRERVDSKGSAVSLSGIQTALKSVFGRISSISESAAGDEAEEGNQSERTERNAVHNVPQEELQSQDDEDSQSQVAAISDMLISQTQEGSQETTVEETVVEISKVIPFKKRSRKQAQEQVDDDKVDGEATVASSNCKHATKPDAHYGPKDDDETRETEENVATSENRDREKAAQNKRAKKTDARLTRVPKEKKKGMLSLWKEQRARRREREANNM